MEPLKYKFGTASPLPFRERGCDERFETRLLGTAEVTACDPARWGAADEAAPMQRKTAELLQQCLAAWPGDVLLVNGREALGAMLEEKLAASGITARVTIGSIALTEESEKRYRRIFADALKASFDAAIPRASDTPPADAPHGLLRSLRYDLTTHGMMAGSGSWSSDSIDWNDDGSAELRITSNGGGWRSEAVYRVRPEAAELLRRFVTEMRLASYAGIELPASMMGVDNCTTATIAMTFDDRALGGSADAQCLIRCGMSGMYFGVVEKRLRKLLDVCRETGECVRSEMDRTDGQASGMMGAMGTMAAKMYAAGTQQKPEDGRWTCPACGHDRNSGKFCVNCGAKRP